MSRPSGRATNALRTISLEPSVSLHAEGSCLAKFGNTHVLSENNVCSKPNIFSEKDVSSALKMSHPL